ncbi:MAG: hypothetical protein ACYCWN_01400 [Ferrimicrobium sp.]
MTRRVLDVVDMNATAKTDGMVASDGFSDIGNTHAQTASARLSEDEDPPRP